MLVLFGRRGVEVEEKVRNDHNDEDKRDDESRDSIGGVKEELR